MPLPDCPMRRVGPKFTLQREHGLVGPPLAVFIAQLKTATRARTANVNFAGGETRAQLPARCCSLRHQSTGRREMVRERIDRFSQRWPMAAVCTYGRRSVKPGSCRSDVGRSFRRPRYAPRLTSNLNNLCARHARQNSPCSTSSTEDIGSPARTRRRCLRTEAPPLRAAAWFLA